MDNLQGSLAALLEYTSNDDCTFVTITDTNTYSGDLATPAKKAFLVRKHTNGDQVLFTSDDADYTDSNWSVGRSEKGGAGFKDGWCYNLLLVFPVKQGASGIGSSVDKDQIVFYRNDGNTVNKFYIANQNMGGTGEPALLLPDEATGNEWSEPTFDQFYSYIALKEGNDPKASEMEYGYGEEFIKCVGDICRNRLFIEAGCDCECDGDYPLAPANEANLLVESININSANRNFKQGQTIVEKLELLCNDKV